MDCPSLRGKGAGHQQNSSVFHLEEQYRNVLTEKRNNAILLLLSKIYIVQAVCATFYKKKWNKTVAIHLQNRDLEGPAHAHSNLKGGGIWYHR